MNQINLVNLNDAIYQILNRKYDWCAGVDALNFNKVNCPLLPNFDMRSIVSYRDWVAILGGNPNVTACNIGSKLACLRNNMNGTYQYGTWGRTFGAFKGKNGRPLADTKPLDEAFWYYDASQRQMCTTIPNPGAQPGVITYWYHNNGWQFRWCYDGKGYPSDGEGMLLTPGVYGAQVLSYRYAYETCLDINDPTGPVKGWQRLIACYGDANAWYSVNCIFFVDSPVYIRAGWRGASTHIMEGTVFKFTPDGYWE